jgi:hypothetical protein
MCCLLRRIDQHDKTGSSSPIIDFIGGVLVRLLMTRLTNVCVSHYQRVSHYQHVSLLDLPENTKFHTDFVPLFHLHFPMFVAFVSPP